MEIKVIAEVYRLGLAIGYHSVQDVIRWADTIIEQLDKPPYEIIEISLSSKEKLVDVCSKLHMFYGGSNNDLPSKIILALLNKYFLSPSNTSDIFSMLSRLNDYVQLDERNEWITGHLFYLSDAYYLAEQNIYGSLQEVNNDLKKFLMQFVDYTKYFVHL
ncbi:ribosomal protein L31 [Lysinibacillus parviboronicapiens]|uniref:Ribosomal protein L31 n=1 Tax=Lysinibacillus parviboronicapiens TaxID=436516 RepID=A0ABV2PH17_9BACI